MHRLTFSLLNLQYLCNPMTPAVVTGDYFHRTTVRQGRRWHFGRWARLFGRGEGVEATVSIGSICRKLILVVTLYYIVSTLLS